MIFLELWSFEQGFITVFNSMFARAVSCRVSVFKNQTDLTRSDSNLPFGMGTGILTLCFDLTRNCAYLSCPRAGLLYPLPLLPFVLLQNLIWK